MADFPNCAAYKTEKRCYGCGRKLVIKDEMALWFTGHPKRAVFGKCCWKLAAHAK